MYRVDHCVSGVGTCRDRRDLLDTVEHLAGGGVGADAATAISPAAFYFRFFRGDAGDPRTPPLSGLSTNVDPGADYAAVGEPPWRVRDRDRNLRSLWGRSWP